MDTDSRDVQQVFAKRFFDILCEVSAKHPQDPGIRAKNTISRITYTLERRGDMLTKDGVCVSVPDDNELTLSDMYRNVWVKRLPLDKIGTLRKHKGHLQTAAVMAQKNRPLICERLARAGLVRILRPENMTATVSGEAHDGTYALRLYSRIVETE